MKFVFDLQGAQSESRHRGIGRYTRSIALAMAEKARGEHEIWIALNDQLGDSIDGIRESFDGLLPSERIITYSVTSSIAAVGKDSAWRRGASERLRENFLRELNADWLWHSSLFEGWIDDAVTSTRLLNTSAAQATTLYDLIPLVRPKQYLVDARMRSWYDGKITHVKRQDLCFAISEWTRHEGATLLGLQEERIEIATCGVESIFAPMDLRQVERARHRIRLAFGIDRSFVLYLGGFDTRKNVPTLISAFARLPVATRMEHRLVLGGRISDGELSHLHSLMHAAGVTSNEVIFTGQVEDSELVELYSCCDLFVFPSLHEGFGLTVLEAMACGAPVLASSATSLPEVVGRPDMLFDPLDPDDLAGRMAGALASTEMRREWSAYGERRALQFTWQRGAEQMLTAFEKASGNSRRSRKAEKDHASPEVTRRKPTLAYVSPLPPEPSGISDYSAELLPALSQHYAIDVIVSQRTVGASWIAENLTVRSVEWFENNAHRFDRIVYQFGNSPFHLHMFRLLERFPGTVVLHDSFLGGLSHWRSFNDGEAGDYVRRLYASHGYRALLDDKQEGREFSLMHYPSSFEIFGHAIGVLVHSQYAMDRAKIFYGNHAASWMRRVPFPKEQRVVDKALARARLGLDADAFVVCSFGMLAPTKLNHRLLDSWLASKLAQCPECRLIFVGENHGGDYGQALANKMDNSAAQSAVGITGFAEDETYKTWLAAADVAVQLRTESRGETSAAVFDCMGHGLPLIVNAHATFSELADECLIKLPDAFANEELATALEQLFDSRDLRMTIGERARNEIASRHSLLLVAAAYRDAIEELAASHPLAQELEAIDSIAAMRGSPEADDDVWQTSTAFVKNRKPMHLPSLFIDVTVVAGNDLKTGIERVTRNLTRELLTSPPNGWRVEPIQLVDGQYFRANDFACRLLDIDPIGLAMESVEPLGGDIFLGLDWVADQVPEQLALYRSWRNRSVRVFFLLYDLLPVLQPQFFPEGIDSMHERWLQAIATCADGVISISETVAEEFRSWLDKNQVQRELPLALGYSHIGANLDRDASGVELSEAEEEMLLNISQRPTVLVVGTIEPRKGQLFALEAAEWLWQRDSDLNLVIVGKLGWMMEVLEQRLLQHPELNKRLFWQPKASDALLNRIYRSADVLLATSKGEGFGLPLIEAAQHAIPVLARDLPVFREIAGEYATYFNEDHPEALGNAISQWFAAKLQGIAPGSEMLPWLTWEQSACQLVRMVLASHATGWLAPWQTQHDPGIRIDIHQGQQLIPGNGKSVSFSGWGQPEPWGRWALGRRPRIRTRVLDRFGKGELRLELDASAFVTDEHPDQHFSIYANGDLLGEWSHHIAEEKSAEARQWVVPETSVGDHGELELTIVQDQSVSPQSIALSADTRMLGLAVKRLSLRWLA